VVAGAVGGSPRTGAVDRESFPMTGCTRPPAGRRPGAGDRLRGCRPDAPLRAHPVLARRPFQELEKQVRQLWEQHRRTPFPDCRGVVVDGVDLVVVNADLDGCLRHFLVGPRSGGDDLQLLILREVAEALVRVVPRLVPGRRSPTSTSTSSSPQPPCTTCNSSRPADRRSAAAEPSAVADVSARLQRPTSVACCKWSVGGVWAGRG